MFMPSEFQNIYINYQEDPSLKTEDIDYKNKFYQYFKLNEDVKLKLDDILLFFPNVSISKLFSFNNWCGLYKYVEKEKPKDFFLLTYASKPYVGKFTKELFYKCVNNEIIKCWEIASEFSATDY